MTDAAPRFSPEDLLLHADWARELAAHLVGDASAADDLAQEALVAAIRKPPRADRPLRPWLAGVMRNLALARRRGEARRARREEVLAAASARREVPDAAEMVASLDAYRALTEVVAALPEPLRETVYLRYFENLDSSQIAARQGVPAGTVRWRLTRALEELRERLDARSPRGRNEWLGMLAPLALPRRGAPRIGSAAHVSSSAAVLTGVLAMGTATKVLLAAGAALAALLLLTATHVVDLPPFGTSEPSDLVPQVSFRPESRVRAARPPRHRAAEESDAHDAKGGASAGAGPVAQTGHSLLEVRAHVLGPTGAPATGGRVEVAAVHPGIGADADADGRVTFPLNAAESARGLAFAVSAFGCATRIVASPLAAADRLLDLGDVRLGPGGSVAGRVVDADDLPVEGAVVAVITGSANGAQVIDVAPLAWSGADGSFTLRGAPEGNVRLQVEKTGYVARRVAVAVRGGEETYGVVVALQADDPSSRVRGVVTAPDGTPVPRAMVTYRCEGFGGSSSGTMSADDKGRFDIQGGTNKTWRLTARDPDGRWSGTELGDVRSGATDVALRLTAARLVEVAPTAADGSPVLRFAVDVRSESGSVVESLAEAEHAQGVAAVRVPAQRFTIDVTAPGYAVASSGPYEPTETSRVAVRLAALPGVRGRVTLDGAAVAGARVSLRDVVPPGCRVEVDGFLCASQAAPESPAACAADGSFELTLRRAGRFLVRAEAEGLAPAEAGPFDLKPDVGRADVTISLTRGGSLEGHVLVDGDRSVSSVIVGISRADGAARTLRAGADGSFRFEHLTPGAWLVREADRELARGQTTVISNSGEPRFEWSCRVEEGAVARTDLDLRSGARPSLRAGVLVDGRPAQGWRVALLEGTVLLTAQEVASGASDASGEVRLAAARPVQGFVRAISPRGVRFHLPVETGATETSLTMNLRTGSVSLRRIPADEPLALLGEDASGTFALVEAPSGDTATLPFLAGHVRVARPVRNEMDPRKWASVVEGDLAPGGTLVLEFPAR